MALRPNVVPIQRGRTKFVYKTQAQNQVFGATDSNLLLSPAKTFRSRNHSLITESNSKKQPMRVREQLKIMNGFNYSVRKFHLRSKDMVDRLLPTQLSVANLLFDLKKPVQSSTSDLQAP